jgi:hypothetical protein
MSILSSVEQFFENLWTNVLKPDAQKAEQVVEVFFEQAETAVENELGVEGLKIVTDAVSAAETAGGTGLQKLAAAQASIASDLSAANIADVAQNTINVAIEGAVAQLKSAQTPDTPDDSTQQGDTGSAAGNDNSGTSTDPAASAK